MRVIVNTNESDKMFERIRHLASFEIQDELVNTFTEISNSCERKQWHLEQPDKVIFERQWSWYQVFVKMLPVATIVIKFKKNQTTGAMFMFLIKF